MSKLPESAKQWRDAGILAVPLLSAKRCQAILAKMDKVDDWEPAKVSADEPGGSVTGELRTDVRQAEVSQFAGQMPILVDFRSRIEKTLMPAIRAAFGAVTLEPHEFSMVRYQAGGHYLPHVDNGGELAFRVFSVVCYLNDDFDGGGTDFPNLGMTVTPRAGMAIAFPSEYLHAALPVVAGTKQVLICWLRGPLPIQWI